MNTNNNDSAAQITDLHLVAQDANTFLRVRDFRLTMRDRSPEENDRVLKQMEEEFTAGSLSQSEAFLSLAGLARRVDIPESRMTRLHRAGVFTEDGTIDRTFLFRAVRVEEIRAQIAAHDESQKGAAK